MLELHFSYAAHWRQAAVVPLWRKLLELHKAGKRILYVASEKMGAIRAKRGADRENVQFIDDIAKQMKQSAQQGGRRWEEVIRPEHINSTIDRYADYLRLSGGALNAGTKTHALGIHLVAGLFEVPVESLEYARARKSTRIRHQFPKSEKIHADAAGAQTPEEMLKRFRHYFFVESNRNIARHQEIAKNLVRMAKKQPNGHIVFEYGSRHGGMEKAIVDELKRNKIDAKIGSVTTRGDTPSLLQELIQKRYERHDDLPSDLEMARGTLHHILMYRRMERGMADAAVRHGLEPDRVDVDQNFFFREQARTSNAYTDMNDKSKKLIRKMTQEQIEAALGSVIRENMTVEQFVAQHSKKK